MTLAFALRGSNGLVLGADSRVSTASGSADTSTKFLQVNREIGILTYGLAEVGYKSINSIVDQVNGYSDFSSTVKPRIVHFSEITKETQKICKKIYGDVTSGVRAPAVDLRRFPARPPAAGRSCGRPWTCRGSPCRVRR